MQYLNSNIPIPEIDEKIKTQTALYELLSCLKRGMSFNEIRNKMTSHDLLRVALYLLHENYELKKELEGLVVFDEFEEIKMLNQ